MRPVPPVAATQFGVFTTAQALAAGWTSHALRHAVGHGYLERLRPGAFAVPDDQDAVGRLRQAATAFSLTNPGVTVSHAGAAAVLGIDLLEVPRRVCATYPRGHRGPMASVHRHRGRLGPGDVGRLGCVRLTSPARTVLDVGHELGADAAIVAADTALRRRLSTTTTLDAVRLATAHWPGVTAVHRAMEIADAASESPLESLSRLRLARSTVPLPCLQPPILGSHGEFLGRPDFYWDEVGVIGEADGMVKYDGVPDSLVAEKRRQGRLEDAGLIVVRWGWSDLARFDRVVAELRAAFARGVRPDRAPRLWRLGTWPRASAAS